MSDERGAVVRLGRFEIRLAQRQVLADGLPARVGARAFDLLVALIERRDRVVGYQELFDLVWPGAVVEDNNLQVHVSALRKLLGRETIVTVPGRGYRFASPLLESSATRPAEPPCAPDTLPRSLTSFIGREQDIAQLLELSATTRLLVLTGAGGCGKSRLSIELARRLLPGLRDGVCLVELAPLADPALVPQTVAAALGLADKAGMSPTQSVVVHLASRQMLLLIDNAEHLLVACAALVDSVLRQCPGVVVLATSRERLGITGELSYRVPSLRVPDARAAAIPIDELARCEAVRLFVERAQLQLPPFRLTAHNADAVASVCRRLDGIPLAIELAAARTRSLSIDEISQRLDQRFDLLTGGSRTALPRHQTLRSLIDWSHDLLDVHEQALLCRLSVFAGGWSLEAAEQVCSGPDLAAHEVLPLLTALVDKSLVLAEDRGGRTRYRMLESVLHYARDKLQQAGDADHWRTRHGAYFIALAETAKPALKGAEQGNWFDLLALELDNLRAVLASAAGGDASTGLQLAARLGRFWSARGHSAELLDWIRRLLALANDRTPLLLRAEALSTVGSMAFDLCDYRQSAVAHEEALALYRGLGDRSAIAAALIRLGSAAYMRADYATAQALHEESLDIMRETGDTFLMAGSLHNLGAVAGARGDHLAAQTLYAEAVAIYRAAGHVRGVAWGLVNMGAAACVLDDFGNAARLLEEALTLGRQIGDQPSVAAALMNLGNVSFETGELATAAAHFDESLLLTQQLGDRFGMADLLIGLARLRAACGQAGAAGQLFGAAQRLREELESPIEPGEQALHERRVATARAACGDGTRFDEGWQEGRARSLDDVLRALPSLPVATAAGAS